MGQSMLTRVTDGLTLSFIFSFLLYVPAGGVIVVEKYVDDSYFCIQRNNMTIFIHNIINDKLNV